MLPAMSTLVDRLLPDELWQRIKPLLPASAGPAPWRGPASGPGPLSGLVDRLTQRLEHPRVGAALGTGRWCPVSLDLARQHVADLRRVRLVETASSWLSH
jgi:hypothetical protein